MRIVGSRGQEQRDTPHRRHLLRTRRERPKGTWMNSPFGPRRRIFNSGILENGYKNRTPARQTRASNWISGCARDLCEGQCSWPNGQFLRSCPTSFGKGPQFPCMEIPKPPRPLILWPPLRTSLPKNNCSRLSPLHIPASGLLPQVSIGCSSDQLDPLDVPDRDRRPALKSPDIAKRPYPLHIDRLIVDRSKCPVPVRELSSRVPMLKFRDAVRLHRPCSVRA